MKGSEKGRGCAQRCQPYELSKEGLWQQLPSSPPAIPGQKGLLAASEQPQITRMTSDICGSQSEVPETVIVMSINQAIDPTLYFQQVLAILKHSVSAENWRFRKANRSGDIYHRKDSLLPPDLMRRGHTSPHRASRGSTRVVRGRGVGEL